MKNKKILLFTSIVFGLTCLFSYIGFAQVNKNDMYINSGKNLIQDINKITNENFNEKINTSKDYNDKTHNSTIKQLSNNDICLEYDDQGRYLSFINNLKKDELITRTQKSKNINTILDVSSSLKDKATGVVKSFKTTEEKNSGIEVDLTFIGEFQLPDGTIAFKWARSEEGYKYDADFAMVIIDPIDGSVIAASKSFISDKPSNKINILLDDAIDIAKTFIEKDSLFNVNNILKSELKIVNPNFYWTDPTVNIGNKSKFAYEITFGKASPNIGEASIWIDAENGNIIGGQQTK